MEPGFLLQERYRLERQMGRNAGRQTWLATDLAHPEQERVTIKLLTFGGDVQWQDLKLFEREAQTLKQLQHGQIPQYRDYFSMDDRSLWFGLVQEYIPGHSLKELLDGGERFSEKRVLAIAKEILQVLIYLHQLKPPILHRDIKPSNLIQGEDQRIYLVDFGAVQDRAVGEGSTFTVVGTYGYCPLEQFGGKASPASDLYALGATLIHLLTGVAPGDLPSRDLKLDFRNLVQGDRHFMTWLEHLVEPALENRLGDAAQALELLEKRTALPLPQRKLEIRKPLNSAITLKSFPERLEITIPRRGLTSILDYLHGLHLLSFLTVVTVLFLLESSIIGYGIIFWILWGGFAWRSLTYLFRETQILFNRNSYSIKKNLFGFSYFFSKGLTTKVQDISLAHQTFSQWGNNAYKPLTIMMTCEALLNPNRYDRRTFGEGLNEKELIWLAQEIRNWLFDYHQ